MSFLPRALCALLLVATPLWAVGAPRDLSWQEMIPPDAQRMMSKRTGATVVEVKGSHAVYVSQP